MGNSTNLLETLVRAYYEQSEKKAEIVKQFRDYHMEVIESYNFV